MGAGKSTIGKMLSTRLGFPFLDTDNIIEDRTGADIPWIFDVEGEQGFRDREAAILKEVLVEEGCVIATGGGIVAREENRELLKQHTPVVYLSASIDQLVDRTYKDKKRPLLQVNSPRGKITELFLVRDPLYREVADHIVTTDSCGPKHVVQAILDLL